MKTVVEVKDLTKNDKKQSFVEALSGGQKQHLAMALALVNNPRFFSWMSPQPGLTPRRGEMCGMSLEG